MNPGESNQQRRHLAIVGSVGIPNRYGGPEAFAESIAPALVARGFEVTVTCDKSRYTDDLSERFKGARRVFIGIGANGASSPLHDLVAFMRVVRHAHYILVLGVSGGLFFPIFRLACALTGSRLLVNIDGVEWRRSKFGPFGKLVLYCSDLLAQWFAHVIIYDNDALRPYVRQPRKAACVAYSGDHAVLNEPPAASNPLEPYALTICRIEPENNCDVLIEGFLQSSLGKYVFVGNWSRSEYGRGLRRRYASEPRLQLLDPVYEPRELYRLRSHCTFYLHGHSVGGTNPSLVEMLFFDCDILCWDCSFNRATARDAIRFFTSAEHLAQLLTAGPAPVASRESIRRSYTRDAIVAKLCAALELSDARAR
jgi:glycosyltransferase involved in cell wall biosynthesis